MALVETGCSFCNSFQLRPADTRFIVCPDCRVASRAVDAAQQPISLGRWPSCFDAEEVGAQLSLDGRLSTVVSVLEWVEPGDELNRSHCCSYRLIDETGQEHELQRDLRLGRTRWWRCHTVQESEIQRSAQELGYRQWQFPGAGQSEYLQLCGAIGYFDRAPIIDDGCRSTVHTGSDPRYLLENTEGMRLDGWALLEQMDAPAFRPNPAQEQQRRALRAMQTPLDRHFYALAWLASTVLILLLHLLFTAGSHDAALVQFDRQIADSAAESWISEPFELRGSIRNIESRLSADVRESGLAAQVCLIEATHWQRYCLHQRVESYRDDESRPGWQERTARLGGVPAGRYLLEVDAQADGGVGRYRVSLHRDATRHGPVLAVLLTLLLVPILVEMHRARALRGESMAIAVFLLLFGYAFTLEYLI